MAKKSRAATPTARKREVTLAQHQKLQRRVTAVENSVSILLQSAGDAPGEPPGPALVKGKED